MPDVSLNGIEFEIKGSSDQASISIEELLKELDSLKKSINQTARVAPAIKSIGDAAKKANNPIKDFANSIKRIAMYRIIRSIIKEITEAIREGAQNFYEYSKAVGAPFAAAMDSVKNASLTMKNQVGSAFGELFQIVVPIIIDIISYITQLASALSMIWSALQGKSGWYKAADGIDAVGDAAAGAGHAAKEALKYLAPFDELNRLPKENAGGGGGASATNYGEMFNFQEFEESSALGKIAEFIRENLEAVQLLVDIFGFTIGVVALVMGNFALGLGLMAYFGYKGVQAISVNWDAISQQLQGPLGQATATVAAASLVIGIFALLAGNIPLGIGLIMAGAAGLATVVAANWENIVNFGKKFVSKIKSGITDGMSNISSWVEKKIINPIAQGLKETGAKIKLTVNIIKPWYEQKIKPYFEISRWAAVGKKIISGIKASFPALNIDPIKKWYNETIKPWFTYEKWHNIGANAFSWLKSSLSLGSHSPIKSWWDTYVAPWFTWEKWKTLGTNAVKAIKEGLQSITFPKFHFEWGWETKGFTVLGKYISMSIPWPKLSFYAHGGIVDKATLFGNSVVGEAGKEAIVPLERNTEWVGMVASGLVRELAKASDSNDGGSMADALYYAFSRALAENSDDRDILLDGDVVYRKMVQRNRRETFRSGVNPMMSMG